jgi:hypothetical protein
VKTATVLVVANATRRDSPSIFRSALMSFIRLVSSLAVIAAIFAPRGANAVAYLAALLDPATIYTETTASRISGNSIIGTGEYGRALDTHALLWPAGPGTPIDLNPAGYDDSYGYSVFGNQQVGMAHRNGKQHAMLWGGSAASAVDLHPNGFVESSAYTIAADRQAGWASLNVAGLPFHAIIWNGSANDYVDLNPTGYQRSVINAMVGHAQVGEGLQEPDNNRHAMLWHDTAQSAVDLHPIGFLESRASAIVGNTQIGYGFDTTGHALLWRGTAQSATDLTPTGFTETLALGASVAGQVGYGSGPITNDTSHALYWNGTPQSVIDLHDFLSNMPINFVRSFALGINENGTIAGYAQDSAFRDYAIIWTPIPEPTSLILAALGVTCAAAYPRCRVSRGRGF